MSEVEYAYPDFDEYLLADFTHPLMFDTPGAHLEETRGQSGTHLTVGVAPNALRLNLFGVYTYESVRCHPVLRCPT